MRTKGRLVLENGFSLDGTLFGDENASAVGEVVFNTAMSGYQEIITDPSYAGQIVAMTYPLIGNYGTNAEDDEREKVHMRGLVVRELSSITSNFRSRRPLAELLRDSGVIGIQGVDTRALTREIRESGAMRALIVKADESVEAVVERLKAAPGLSDEDFVKQVTLAESKDWTEGYTSDFAEESYLPEATGGERPLCAAIDFGAKHNILRCLVQAGFAVRVFPATATSEEILKSGPDCVFLSNGPGDPAILDYAITTVKGLIASGLPIFGICLGHQLLTWALGGTTYKLKFGHHGANHPVKDLTTNRIEITSQNHGFATDPDTLPEDVEVTHVNLNDNVISGLRWKNGPVFSVQFHPEASPGPHDSLHLFQRFAEMVKETRGASSAKS